MDQLVGRRKTIAMLSGLLLAPVYARGQADTKAPLRIIHGYVSGSNPDTIARLIAPSLETALGRTVIVEGRPGAAERVAARFVKSQPPDGSTLYLMTSGANVISATDADPGFDTRTDFSYLSTIIEFPFVFLVGTSSPFKSFDEMLVAAKAGATPLSCGHGGLGTTSHLAAELMAQKAGVKLTMVPYKDIGQMYTDLVAGRLDMTCSTFTVYGGHIEQGKVRALAVTSKARWPLYSKIPAVSESIKDFEVNSWMGLAMGAGVAHELTDRYALSVARLMSDAGVRQRLLAMGNMPAPSTPEQFKARVLGDYEKWRPLANLIRQ